MTVKQLSSWQIQTLRSIIKKYDSELASPALNDDLLNHAWNNIPDTEMCRISKGHLLSIKSSLSDKLHSPSLGPDCEETIFRAFFASREKILKNNMTKQRVPSISETNESEQNIENSITSPKPSNTDKTDSSLVTVPDLSSIQSDSEDSEQRICLYDDTARRVSETDTVTSEIAAPLVEDKQTGMHGQTAKAEDCDHYDLKNGKVSQEYSDTINLEKIFLGGKIRDYTIEGLDEIGLELDAKTGQLTGIPMKQGDPAHNFEFELFVRYETENGEKESKKIFIKILPDPKSLWKILEPPEEFEDRKLHEYKKQILIKKNGFSTERNIIAASKRGRSHAHRGSFRDDHVSIKYLDEFGWSILAVADGAGSANLSRVASQIACETAITNISSKLMVNNDDLSRIIKDTFSKAYIKGNKVDDNKLRKLLYEILSTTGFEAAKAIHEEAAKRQVKVNQFYTTYLTTIHKEFDFGNFFAGFWVGDGALGVYSKSKEIKLLGIPDEGEYSGQTKFITMNEVLTSEQLMGRIYYKLTDDFTALFAMSDGVSDAKFENDKNLNDISYWDNLWAELEKDVFQAKDNADNRLLEWLDFWAEGEHDDRTIVILY